MRGLEESGKKIEKMHKIEIFYYGKTYTVIITRNMMFTIGAVILGINNVNAQYHKNHEFNKTKLLNASANGTEFTQIEQHFL